MNENFYFEILDTLHSQGVNIWIDLSDILKKKYPDNYVYLYASRIDMVNSFLSSIKKDGYIDFSIEEKFNELIPSMVPIGFEVTACLTISGFEFINNFRRDKSTIETNNSIKKNNSRQTIILIFTLIFSLCSLIISWLNYTASKNVTNSKSLPKLKDSTRNKILRQSVGSIR